MKIPKYEIASCSVQRLVKFSVMDAYISPRPVAITLAVDFPEEIAGEPMFVHCIETGELGHFITTLLFTEKQGLGLVASIGGFGHPIGNGNAEVDVIPFSRIQYLTQAAVDAIVIQGIEGMPFRSALISPEFFEEKNGRLEYRGSDYISIHKPLA